MAKISSNFVVIMKVLKDLLTNFPNVTASDILTFRNSFKVRCGLTMSLTVGVGYGDNFTT